MAKGILCGIVTIPIGVLAGGLTAGFPVRLVVSNLIPIVVIGVLIALGLWKAEKAMIKGFGWFGKGVVAVIYRDGTVSADLEKIESDGLALIKLDIGHELSGEKYQFLIVSGASSINAAEVSATIAQNVSDVNNTFVLLTLPESESYASGFEVPNMTEKYNSPIYVGAVVRRVALLHGENIKSGTVSADSNNLGTAAFVSVTLDKPYCDAYLKNIKQ
jgi:hypothetical protein